MRRPGSGRARWEGRQAAGKAAAEPLRGCLDEAVGRPAHGKEHKDEKQKPQRVVVVGHAEELVVEHQQHGVQ